jgi:hypothetical protein
VDTAARGCGYRETLRTVCLLYLRVVDGEGRPEVHRVCLIRPRPQPSRVPNGVGNRLDRAVAQFQGLVDKNPGNAVCQP